MEGSLAWLVPTVQTLGYQSFKSLHVVEIVGNREGLTGTLLTPSMNSKVQSSTYSAEVGGAPGGQVNVTTKSGTNAYHGTAWEFNRNDAFIYLASCASSP